jgi:alkylation response protein AidB-like acyl-CoA dehydrogenase
MLVEALEAIGGADLSAGRIFEGHVNAVKLVFRYGDAEQQAALAADVRAGAVCGVWNAEAPPGLRLDAAPMRDRPGVLTGAKIYASGLGLVTRPLFTAKTPEGRMLMLAPRLPRDQAYDLSAWRVRGMRATATGTIDFTGLAIAQSDVIGAPDDYYRSPTFKGGAWRFAAVQCGAASRLAVLMREELRARRRTDDPHQKARVGTAALAAETARLWVARAAAIAEDPAGDPAAADAYVNLARLAVERSALEVIALVERGLGLSAFTRPSPVERVVRDLSTYLRQPFPDGALEGAASYLMERDGAPNWDQDR